MYFTLALVASLAVSAHALATPQVAGLHRRHQHAALAKARAPVAEPAAFAQPDASAAAPKRQLRKRCKARKPAGSSSSSSADPASASAPVNVGSAPSSEQSPPSPSPSSSSAPAHAPSPSPSPAPAPSPSPSKAAPKPSPKPTNDPAPVTGGQSSSIFSGSQIGQGTFYGTGLGACGITNKDTDFIAAVSLDLFDVFPGYKGGNPNNNPVCGKKVRATYQGKSVEVTITDRCVGCKPTDLDFSPSAFNTIADPAVGRISGMHWEWL